MLNHKSVFLQILHGTSVSWKITPLYFLVKILYILNKRSLSKYKFDEILHFDRLLLVQIKKLSIMTVKSDSEFKVKLTCGFRHDMRNLVNFHPTTQPLNHWKFHCHGLFLFKVSEVWAKTHRGVIFHDTEQW